MRDIEKKPLPPPAPAPKREPRKYRMTHFVRRNGVVMYRLACPGAHEVPRSSPQSIEEPCPTCG